MVAIVLGECTAITSVLKMEEWIGYHVQDGMLSQLGIPQYDSTINTSDLESLVQIIL